MTIVNGSAGGDFIPVGFIDADGDAVTSGPNKIYAGDGNDVVLAGGANDTIRGDNGDDFLFGFDGDDVILGGRGNDFIEGGKGDDKIYGNKGNNVLFGNEGDDLISSGDQTSILDGGADDDTLILRTKKGGDHIATGGTGADAFQFIQTGKSAISNVTITDFELGIDTFSIEGVDGAAYMADLALAGTADAAVTALGGDTLLTLTTGDTIRFQGITETQFEDFFGI